MRQSHTNIVPLEMFVGSVRTMSIQQIEHQWQLGDSVEWTHSRDSIARALVRWGGVPHTCAEIDSMLSKPPDPNVYRPAGALPLRAWRLPDQDEMVGAQHRPGSDYWTISITAFPSRLPLCQRRHRRLMTVGEALAAIHRTIAEQIGF